MSEKDMDRIVRQVAMDGLPAGQTRIFVRQLELEKKLDRILEILEKED